MYQVKFLTDVEFREQITLRPSALPRIVVVGFEEGIKDESFQQMLGAAMALFPSADFVGINPLACPNAVKELEASLRGDYVPALLVLKMGRVVHACKKFNENIDRSIKGLTGAVHADASPVHRSDTSSPSPLRKAGALVALVAGIFGVILTFATFILVFLSDDPELQSKYAANFSRLPFLWNSLAPFIAIVCAAVLLNKNSRRAAIVLMATSGAAVISTTLLVAVSMGLSFVGGAMVFVAQQSEKSL